MPKTVKPKRNKLSQRRSDYRRQHKSWMEQQRYKAWMLHEMIDQDLNNLRFNPIRQGEEDVVQEEE